MYDCLHQVTDKQQCGGMYYYIITLLCIIVLQSDDYIITLSHCYVLL